MQEFNVSTLDVFILIAYVLGTRLFFGWYFALKTREGGSETYFLAGRKLRWPIIGLSFYVSNMSGSSFVGLPGSGYANGISVYNYEWLPALILVLFVIFLLPFYLKARVSTAPQFLEKRYSAGAKKLFSAFLLLANIFIDAAAALYAGATVFEVLIPGFPLWVPIAAASLLAGGYIFFGGLGAVVLNDVVQAIVIAAGGLAISVLTWQAIPSWDAVRAQTPPHALHLFQPVSDPVLPWPGVFTGVLIVGIYFWCMNQFIIQRAIGAESLDQARWGSIFAGLLKLPNLYLLVLPGVMGAALFPNLERPDVVFPTLAFKLLPVGFRGLILAAVAAAILSSLESIFNSVATLFTLDFYQPWRPNSSDKTLVRVGRLSTIGCMVLAAAWAPQIQYFPTLWQYLQSILSYVTPPVVAVFLLGVFWRRANHHGAFWTLAFGLPLGALGWAGNEIFGLMSVQFLYASGIILLLSCGICVAVSLATPAPPKSKTDTLTWRPNLWTVESAELANTPWWKNYRWQSAALLAVTGAILWVWA